MSRKKSQASKGWGEARQQKSGQRAGEQGVDSDKESSGEGQFPAQTENLVHTSSWDETILQGRGSPEPAGGRGQGGSTHLPHWQNWTRDRKRFRFQ